ncbi:MAG: hypothetical protein HQL95_00780 [Magnetococcales bacterium]|nr:hypothetical protein [Magnetococcales bacterium]
MIDLYHPTVHSTVRQVLVHCSPGVFTECSLTVHPECSPSVHSLFTRIRIFYVIFQVIVSLDFQKISGCSPGFWSDAGRLSGSRGPRGPGGQEGTMDASGMEQQPGRDTARHVRPVGHF